MIPLKRFPSPKCFTISYFYLNSLFKLSQPPRQYSDIPPPVSCGCSSDSSSFILSPPQLLLIRGSRKRTVTRGGKWSCHVLSANCKQNIYCNICTTPGVTFNTRAVKQAADTASITTHVLITSRLHFRLRPLINCRLWRWHCFHISHEHIMRHMWLHLCLGARAHTGMASRCDNSQ